MKRLTAFALLFVLFVMAAASGQIAPELRQKMDQAGDNEYLPVIVAYKEHFDAAQIARAYNVRGDEEAVKAQLVDILKAKAEESHHWLKQYSEQRSAEVVGFKSFWIANMVALKATPAALEEIARQPEVEEIFLDEEQVFIDYKPGVPTRDAWGLEKIGSKEVNKTYTGKGVLVAVIDTGVNYNHEDLKGRVLMGKDCINNDMDPLDDNGHGSHCAGTVAGTTFGVAPEATILAVKVLSGYGSGSWQNVADGVQYVAEYKGVHVASMSLGGRAPIQKVLRDAFDNAVKMGIRFAVAAGNSGPSASTIGTPGDQKDICSVGATDINDAIAGFSSRGPVKAYGEPYIKPDVSAPGVNITSCWKGASNATKTISGTSMATPHIAGLMALMMQANPNLGFLKMREILENTALDFGTKGKDNIFGSGRVQAVKAVEAAKSVNRDGRIEIEKELVFPIGPDGAINMEVTKENPLWEMDVKITVTVLEPAGTYSGSFELIKPGKSTQKGQITDLPSGKAHTVGVFTVYDGNNTLKLKAQYTGASKATEGKILVKAVTQ